MSIQFMCEQIGTVLRSHREKSKLSQAELARMIGITRSRIAQVERGSIKQSLAVTVLLAYVLGEDATKQLSMIIKSSRKFMDLTSRLS